MDPSWAKWADDERVLGYLLVGPVVLLLLGLVAYRVGKKIQYDPKTGTSPDTPEANVFMGKQYREGWSIDG